jgi:hypothetical protein
LEARGVSKIVPTPDIAVNRATSVWALTALCVVIVGIVPHVAAGRQDSSAPLGTRPCKASDHGELKPKKPIKQKKHRRTEQQDDTANACLEASGTALHIQEQLQSFVRQQRWLVSNEDINETTWTFDLGFNKEELLHYANPDSSSSRVDWQDGKAAVVIRSWDLGDGYARTIVSAKFQGFGESSDSFATQRSPWTLISNGTLEAKIIEGLRTPSPAMH